MLKRKIILNGGPRVGLRRRAAEVLSASLCVCGLLWSAQMAQAAPSGPELLRQMSAAEAKISYSGTQVSTRHDSREVARVWRDGRKRRIEWLAPDLKRGDVLVDDGKKASLYLRSENTVVETNSTEMRLPSGAGATVIGQEKMDGRTAWKVKAGTRTIWIDAATKARLKAQGPWGSIGLEKVQFGPVPSSRFRFVPPAGTEKQKLNGTTYPSLTSARRAAPWLKSPAQLPAGYTLESAIVGPDTVWLRYANTNDRFSLFIQKAEQGTVEPRQMEGGWFWKRDGLRYYTTGAPSGSVSNMYSSLQ